MANQKGVHAGHRQRMHQRCSSMAWRVWQSTRPWSICSISPMPRRTPTPLPTLCWKNSGTWRGVLEASEEDLCSVEGVGAGLGPAAPPAAPSIRLLPPQPYPDRRRMKTTEDLGGLRHGPVPGHFQRAGAADLPEPPAADYLYRLAGPGDGGPGCPCRCRRPSARRCGCGPRAPSCVTTTPAATPCPPGRTWRPPQSWPGGMHTVGIELLDHLIVTDTEYTSLRQRSEMPVLLGDRVRLAHLREEETGEDPEEKT